MDSRQSSYLLLHLSVICWSFTAILGDLISLSAGVLVWWRVGLTSILLLLWPGLLLTIQSLDTQTLKKYILIGILIALHWVCFYAAIKLANASVGLITMSTTAFFTAVIEPRVLKTKIDKVDIILSVLVIPGMLLITDGLDSKMLLGFWLGILSAILLAYFSVLNRQVIDESSPICMTFVEMSSAWVFLTLCSPIVYYLISDITIFPSSLDTVYLLILVMFCTILPFVMHLIAMKHLSAFAINLIVNLEPVYGILLAMIILREHQELSIQFYLGVVLIVLIVLIYPSLKKRLNGLVT